MGGGCCWLEELIVFLPVRELRTEEFLLFFPLPLGFLSCQVSFPFFYVYINGKSEWGDEKVTGMNACESQKNQSGHRKGDREREMTGFWRRG